MNSRHSNSVKRKIKHTTLNWFKQIRNRKLELKYMLLSLTRHRNPRSILQSLLLTVLRIASLNYWESERGRDRKLLKIFSCLFAGQCREEREFREWDVFVKNYYIIIFLPILFFSLFKPLSNLLPHKTTALDWWCLVKQINPSKFYKIK